MTLQLNDHSSSQLNAVPSTERVKHEYRGSDDNKPDYAINFGAAEAIQRRGKSR